MIISFDIDNTLIPYSNEFQVEDKTFFMKLLGAESIRKGTIDLFRRLENQGHEIWIYTTSFRSIFSLKKTFASYGWHPSKIINEKINRTMLSKHNCRASKNPHLFGIDLHLDDSEGVRLEGEKYDFRTIIVKTTDEDWVNTVLEKIGNL